MMSCSYHIKRDFVNEKNISLKNTSGLCIGKITPNNNKSTKYRKEQNKSLEFEQQELNFPVFCSPKN